MPCHFIESIGCAHSLAGDPPAGKSLHMLALLFGVLHHVSLLLLLLLLTLCCFSMGMSKECVVCMGMGGTSWFGLLRQECQGSKTPLLLWLETESSRPQFAQHPIASKDMNVLPSEWFDFCLCGSSSDAADCCDRCPSPGLFHVFMKKSFVIQEGGNQQTTLLCVSTEDKHQQEARGYFSVHI